MIFVRVPTRFPECSALALRAIGEAAVTLCTFCAKRLNFLLTQITVELYKANGR